MHASIEIQLTSQVLMTERSHNHHDTYYELGDKMAPSIEEFE